MSNKHRTRKSAAKRFKVTASGKVLHRSHHIRHLKTGKSNSQVRRLNQMKELTGVQGKKIKQMLGEA
jgi:large subunit ribosomal protein L35